MRLLVDAQLPPALARWLGEFGLAATSARELVFEEIGALIAQQQSVTFCTTS